MIAVLCIVASIAGIALLASADAKRGRAAGLKRAPLAPPVAWAARVLIFAPGLVLAGLGAWSPFAIWIGTVSVIGWGLAAMPVGGWTMVAAASRRGCESALGHVARDIRGAAVLAKQAIAALTSASHRLRQLEARVEALETELSRLKSTQNQTADREAA